MSGLHNQVQAWVPRTSGRGQAGDPQLKSSCQAEEGGTPTEAPSQQPVSVSWP